MPQKDYILRVAEDVGRALAQIIYHQDTLQLHLEREMAPVAQCLCGSIC